MKPKVFVSYGWTSQAHKELVRSWADRLIDDGIEVILDVYDLREGDDKYAFMEQMVTDPSVSHVLVVCDRHYGEKADDRVGGVGTESQIISKEVYERVQQSKFIPIVCEFDREGKPYLPTFLESRIWIDFSTSAFANENWERLVRCLYGKPQYMKPNLGKAPDYIASDTPAPANSILAKLNSLREAIYQERTRVIGHHRRDFLAACTRYADELRVRTAPNDDEIAETVLSGVRKLKPLRDPIVD